MNTFSRTLLGLCLVVVQPVPLSAAWEVVGDNGADSPTVVLLHGLNRSRRSMEDMAHALARAGYRAVNVDYPSSEHTVAALVAIVGRDLDECCRQQLTTGIDFVTHSLGGVLVRYFASVNPRAAIRRVVMLGPPSQGSELVDVLRDSALYKLVTGPAGQELGTDPTSVPNRLPPVSFELGVITGRSTINPLYSWLIPGVDDGKVSVERARAPGMQDFIVLEESHSFIMSSDEAIRQSIHFLDNGRFDR